MRQEPRSWGENRDPNTPIPPPNTSAQCVFITGGLEQCFNGDHWICFGILLRRTRHEHGNTALYIYAEQVGLTGTDMLVTNVNLDVYAQDFYYGDPGDWVTGLTNTPYGERYYGIPEDIPAGMEMEESLVVYDFGLFPGNTSELGVMLFTNGDRGDGYHGGATQDTEEMLFMAP